MIKLFYNYILCNNLQIDKGTYFAVVIGMVTSVGLFIALHESVVSRMGDERCLGINIAQSYLYSHMWLNKRIVCYLCIFIFCSTCAIKPIMNVYGCWIDKMTQSIICWMWYFGVVVFLVLSVFFIFQGLACISDLKSKNYISLMIYRIKKDFVKRCISNHISWASIDALVDDINEISRRIKIDNGSMESEFYDRIVESLLSEYLKKKKREINEYEIKPCKNQEAFRYNESREYALLVGLVEGQYFIIGDELMYWLAENVPQFIGLNAKRAVLAKEKNVFGKWTLANRKPEYLINKSRSVGLPSRLSV